MIEVAMDIRKLLFKETFVFIVARLIVLLEATEASTEIPPYLR